MRSIAKSFLVLLTMVGLALPGVMARGHDVPCDSAHGECLPVGFDACAPFDSCHECPPPHDCPLDHHDCGDEFPLDHGNSSPEEPSSPHQHEHHHHHHQCMCAPVSVWLIADSDAILLLPPGHSQSRAPREVPFTPESPVFLLDRPPMA